jgi:nucleoside-diphosphate-sugar epimerase
MKKLKFLVTGGAGFLGINLCRYLKKRGHAVRSLDITEFDYSDMLGKVDVVTGDIRDRKTVEKAMEGIDIVVHCAAALPLYTREEIISTDVGGTKNIFEIAHKKRVKRVIYISSTAVYGIPDHHPLYEDDKMSGVGPYGESKIISEELCRKYRKMGMCVPIIRPKTFVGPERLGVFAIYYDWIRRGKNVPIIGSGNNRYQLLDVEDMCSAIYLCATKDARAANDTFNIGAKEFTTMREDFGSVLEYAGHGKHIIGIPEKPVILVLKILEKLNMVPLYKWVYETASEDSFVSIEKAEKVLGFRPKYSNKEALIRNYRWYMKHYKEYNNKTGISHRVPWKQGILGLVRLFF